ncbi:hypothetical protein KSP40_PGU009584 [Platanthera guangdongensis]|uniref:Uncharacterized protein n=1 Tax=Platanthera guangdongensis TaxID=2320717 RepID=A0ABR2LJS7_9ASPA
MNFKIHSWKTKADNLWNYAIGVIGKSIKVVFCDLRPSLEVREQGHNPFDARLSIHHVRNGIDEQESISGTDDIFELEQLVKQKRTETERLTELLHSRTIEVSALPSADYKNKGKLDQDSNVNPFSSAQAVDHVGKEKANASELEYQRKQLVTSRANAISGVNFAVHAENVLPAIAKQWIEAD